MEKHVTIPPIKRLHKGLDFNWLRLKGIEHAQKLSGEIWTDYNEHDPGVTILEYLCYALTDLAYRADFSIEDILFSSVDAERPAVNNAFFTPVEILPTTPVMATDYRRLIIDRIGSVRNAWVVPLSGGSHYQGLFQIRLQLAEGLAKKSELKRVKASVMELVMDHRNLAEDLDDIIILEAEKLSIKANININTDAFGELILARILYTLDNYLNPGIRFYTRQELEKEGLSVEAIFNGPEPLHGFIKTEDLQPLPASTYVSKLREVITKVEGVKMVGKLEVWKDGNKINGDEIVPGDDAYLVLAKEMLEDKKFENAVRLYREDVPVTINYRQVKQFLNNLSAKAKKDFQIRLDLTEPPIRSNKLIEQISAYHSLQKTLPGVYGVGSFGVPENASIKRRAQAKQLKAYLLIFEQVMANYLSQLANVRGLFSIEESVEVKKGVEESNDQHQQTYFGQFPHDIPDGQDYFIIDQETNNSKEDIQRSIAELLKLYDPADERRNRFLDHLLARFGEVYVGDVLKKILPGDSDELAHKLIRGKAHFLRNYVDLSRNRGKAFNYRKPAWEVASNVSGLKKRLSMLLGIDRDMPIDPAARKPRKSTSDQQDGKAVNADNSIPQYANHSLVRGSKMGALSSRSKNKSGAKVPFKKLLSLGRSTENYIILKKKGQYELHFKKSSEESIKIYPPAASKEADGLKKKGENKEACIKACANIIDEINKLNTYSEGFFILENILLRPNRKLQSQLVLTVAFPAAKTGYILFRSITHSSISELQELNTEILIIGSNEHQYRVVKLDKNYYVLLFKGNVPVMISEPAKDESQATRFLNASLHLLLKIRNEQPTRINDVLSYKQESARGTQLGDDFYSLRLSIVVPDWPAIFQTKDFRRFFEQLTTANIPAHLSADFYWLNMKDMATFERAYQAWLDAKAKDNLANTDDQANILRKFLAQQSSVNDQNDHQDKLKTNSTRLSKAVLEDLCEEAGYAFMFKPDRLEIFEGIGPVRLAILQDGGIQTWRDIKNLSANEAVIKQLEETGNQFDKELIASWEKQSSLAISGQWKALIRFQKAFSTGVELPEVFLEMAPIEEELYRIGQDANRIKEILINWLKKYNQQYGENVLVKYDNTVHHFPPYIFDFLLRTGKYGFIIGAGNLNILTDMDQSLAAFLAKESVCNWQDIIDQGVIGISRLLKKAGKGYENIKPASWINEVSFALNNDWKALIAFQQSLVAEEKGRRKTTAVEKEFTRQLRLLKRIELKSDGKGTQETQLLIERLENWQEIEHLTTLGNEGIKELAEAMNFNEFFFINDFTFFSGEFDEQLIELLKEAGITSWQQLAQTKKTELKALLRANGLTKKMAFVADWIKQAELAVAEDWRGLLNYQKEMQILSKRRSSTKVERLAQAWIRANCKPS